MSGVSFDVLLDDVATEAMLGRITAAASDLFEPLDEIGDALVTSTRMRFETGTAPDGSRWPVSKAAVARAGQTLVDDGNLARSIVHEATRDSVTVGSGLVYSRIHQLSGKAGRNHAVALPARPYLGLDADDETMILDTLDAYFRRALS